MNPAVVTGSITVGSEQVARMKRSEIRERSISFKSDPGFHSVPSGLRRNERNKKEAERRKTLFRNLRSLAGCGAAPLRGQHAFRRSTAALARGTHASQRLNLGQASRDTAPKAAGYPRQRRPRLQRAPRMSVIVPAGMIPEPPESKGDEPPPAGTALAPPAAVTRLASFT